MNVKVESRGGNCIVCSKVFGSDSITAAEDVLDLFKFLVETINTSALQNTLICAACLEQLNEAVNFKMSLSVKQETIADARHEIDCDEKFVICYICKNFTKIHAAKPLLNSCYKTVVSYMIPKENLDHPDNLQICDDCHSSLLNFQNMKLFLSVYDLNKANNDQLNSETVTDENEFKIDITDNCLPEDSNINVDITKELKREIKEEIEELDLKIDCKAELSNSGSLWTLKDGQEGTTLPYSENDLDLMTSVSKIEDFEISSDNLKSEKIKTNCEIKMFKCGDCAYQTKRKRDFKRHIILIHQNTNQVEIFKCQTCQYQTKCKGYLKRHVLIHKGINEVEMFKCQHCQYQTKRKSCLKHHLLIHRNTNEVEMFKCQNCKYQTKYKGNIKKHVLIHIDEVNMYKCHNCQYQTKRKSSLTKHLLIHKGISEVEMFKCENCQYQTKNKNYLTKHALIHKGINEVEMFKCQYCQYQTKRKSVLKLHVRNHKDINEDGMFKCQNCEFCTKYKHSLKQHVLLHKNTNEVEMFKCQSCYFQTKYKYYLKKHTLIHKNESNSPAIS